MALPDSTTAQDDWFVVRTQPNRERFAAANVSLAGATPYLPETLERVLIRSRSGRTRRELRRRPLFPSYLFVQAADQRWYFLKRLMGIVGMVTSTEGEPGTVRNTTIQELRVREDSRGLILLPRRRFRPGQKVNALDGLVAGYVGLVREYTADECVKVLIEFMGRKVSFLFEEASLEAA